AAPRLLGGLADCFGDFARLAGAIADPSLPVADDDESGKAEAPTALDHLGDAVDVDKLFSKFALVAIVRAITNPFSNPAGSGNRPVQKPNTFRNPARPRGRRRPGL